jgi:hypothetical protein
MGYRRYYNWFDEPPTISRTLASRHLKKAFVESTSFELSTACGSVQKILGSDPQPRDGKRYQRCFIRLHTWMWRRGVSL